MGRVIAGDGASPAVIMATWTITRRRRPDRNGMKKKPKIKTLAEGGPT